MGYRHSLDTLHIVKMILNRIKVGIFSIMFAVAGLNAMAYEDSLMTTNMEDFIMTTDCDKTFPESDKVEHSKITFHNRYCITLAADLYKPKGVNGKLAAIALSGPYGAINDQVSGR